MCELLLCAGLAAPPAEAQYRIDTWTTEQGLPTNSVTSVLQTRDGFLWMTTYGGLVRFDGATLKTFTTENTPGLRTGRLIALYESRDGALWITTEGLGVTRLAGGVFESFSTAEGLPDNEVGDVFEMPDGTLIVDTRLGAVRWDDGRFVAETALPHRGDRARTVLGRAADGAIWFRDAAGVHRFAGHASARTLSIDGDVVSAYEDRRGRLWLQLRGGAGDHPRTLACVCDGRLVRFGAKDGVPRFETIAWSEDRDGHVWFGLRGNAGLLRYDGRRFLHLTLADGLPGANVERLFQDREGTLWAPTDGGLARLTARPMTTFSSVDGLEADNTYVVYEDRQGTIWIGGWSGLTRYRAGRFEPVSRASGVARANITSILEDQAGTLWLGVWDGGLRLIRDGRVRAVASPVGIVTRAIYQGRGPEVWLGGRDGLAQYRDGVFTRLTDGYPGGEVQVLFEGRDGALWIGTDSGIIRLRDGRFTAFGDADGLTGHPIVRAIHEDADGTLWFGTYDSGLLRFRDGRFTRITTGAGLWSSGAFQILEDAQQRFWITSNTGIYRVARRELDEVATGRRDRVTSVAYGVRDGMRHAEANGGTQPAGLISRDGRIWFPTQQGVVVFDPAAIPVNPLPPPVVITHAAVANRPVPVGPLIEIPSGPTALELQFAALTFVRPEHSRFRFIMEGLDQDWIEAGGERAARYAQLPYGRFVFRVVAANRDGVWNTDGARLTVVVVPPFYRTRWFFALLMGTAVAAGIAVHTWRLRLLRREQDLQQAFSRQLIASQEAERRRIAAGLHDGLQQHLLVIRNWALLGQAPPAGDAAAAQRWRDVDQAAAHALGDVRAIVHDLTPYQLGRVGLARSVKDMVHTVAASSSITFSCEVADVDGRLSKEAELTLFRVIQEALSNIVKHSQARRASVRLETDGPRVRVRITDDGRGFAADPGVWRREGGTGGFGIFGMTERVGMLGGRFEVSSAPGQGAEITITLPTQEGER